MLVNWLVRKYRAYACVYQIIHSSMHACMIPRRRGPGDGWIDGASFRRTVGCPTALSALKSAAFRMHACADPPIDRSRVCIATARTPCKPPAASGVRARRRSTRSASSASSREEIIYILRCRGHVMLDRDSRVAGDVGFFRCPWARLGQWAGNDVDACTDLVTAIERRLANARTGHVYIIQCHLVHSDFYSTGRLYGV